MPACCVELGHELAVGGACCGEVLVAFAELEAHVADLLLQSVVALAERVDVGPSRRARRGVRRAGFRAAGRGRPSGWRARRSRALIDSIALVVQITVLISRSNCRKGTNSAHAFSQSRMMAG